MKQKRLTVKVDPHTFGGSPASENLAKILNDHYPHLVSKVSCFYHKFTEHLTNCLYSARHFPNGGLRTMMELYKQHKFESIRKSGMPDVVISHLLNVMTTSYKINLVVVNRIMINANKMRHNP
jgi:hypothetical protein